MTTPDLKPDDSINNLTVADLEFLISRIVQQQMQPEPTTWEAQIQKIKEQLARPYDKTARSLADIALELASQVPDEDWAEVPTDASIRYRDYLYGPHEEQ